MSEETQAPHPADAATERLEGEAETLRAKGLVAEDPTEAAAAPTPSSAPESSSNGAPSDAPEDPEGVFKIPEELKGGEWLHEVGFFQVGVELQGLNGEDGKPLHDAVVCTDPGQAYVNYLQQHDSEDPALRQKAFVSLARGVVSWKLPATHNSPRLGVTRGSVLPIPETLVDDHVREWEEYERAMKEAYGANRTLARAQGVEVDDLDDATEGYHQYPEHPKTRLEELFTENMPVQVLIRIVSGILHACLKFSGKEVTGTSSGN